MIQKVSSENQHIISKIQSIDSTGGRNIVLFVNAVWKKIVKFISIGLVGAKQFSSNSINKSQDLSPKFKKTLESLILKILFFHKKIFLSIFGLIFHFDYWGLCLRLFFLFGTLIILSMIGLVGSFMYYTKGLPSIDKFESLENIESTKIFDRTGEVLLYEIHAEEKRTIIPLEEMPKYIVDATIAAEDADYYEHYGVNLRSQIRALRENLNSGEIRQGASTITQQLIKNTVLSKERTIDRKVKEIFLAFELERRYSKDQILELYLNRIPYGLNTYGIQTAARTFFEKDAKDLTLAESSILAALPNRPSHLSPYGPYRDTDLKSRQKYILDQMLKQNKISDQELELALAEDWIANLRDRRVEIKVPHFVFFVKDLLEERALEQGMYGGELETAGLKVITTIDLDLQTKAEEVVKQYSQRNKQYNINNMALAAIEPNTGQIITMVGSINYWDRDNDGNVNVTTSYRQPGSSFKPYVYAAAFQNGLGPNSIIYDVKTNFGGGRRGYTPNNYSNGFSGPVNVQTALIKSLNIPAVKAFHVAGAENVISLAHNMGLKNLDPSDAYGPSTALGAKEVRLIDHVSAMGVFGNNGVKVDKTPILKIIDQNGQVLEDNTEAREGEKVMDENVAAMMNYTLTRRSGSLVIPGHAVAAKTGTSNVNYNGRSFPRDTWTVGYTPKIAVAVWAGNNDGSFLTSGAVSTANAGPAYRAFMIEALAKYGRADFSAPRITGVGGGGGHSILHYLGRTRDYQYKRWEESIADFIGKEEKDEEE